MSNTNIASLLGIVITIVAQIFSLFTPELIWKLHKVIEDYVSPDGDLPCFQKSLFHNILLILGTTMLHFFTFLMRQTLIVMSRHVDLKNEIFNHLPNLIAKFLQTQSLEI